jgi:hypothetical protein
MSSRCDQRRVEPSAIMGFQRNARSEAYPRKPTASSRGMTIGGTNQPFIARVLHQDFLAIQDEPLVSAASAPSRARSVSLLRFAPASNVPRHARIRIELCAGRCLASRSPQPGTSRTPLYGYPICPVPRRTLRRDRLAHEASPARPQPTATSRPAACLLRRHSRYRPTHFRTGYRDCIAIGRRPLRRPGAAVSPTRRPLASGVPLPRTIASKGGSS